MKYDAALNWGAQKVDSSSQSGCLILAETRKPRKWNANLGNHDTFRFLFTLPLPQTAETENFRH